MDNRVELDVGAIYATSVIILDFSLIETQLSNASVGVASVQRCVKKRKRKRSNMPDTTWEKHLSMREPGTEIDSDIRRPNVLTPIRVGRGTSKYTVFNITPGSRVNVIR